MIAAALVSLGVPPAHADGGVRVWLIEASRQPQLTVHGHGLQLVPGRPRAATHERLTLRAQGNHLLVTWANGHQERMDKARIASGAGPLRLAWDQGRQVRHVEGGLQVHARADRLRIVAALDDERYVAGVVNGESLADTPWQARLAQAVLGRSYRSTMGRRHPEADADACDQSHCQRWRWPVTALDLAATRQTDRQLVANSQGRPVPVYYHAACGGHTAPVQIIFGGAAQPHLMGVADRVCQSEPTWRAELTLADCMAALQQAKQWGPATLTQVAVVDALPTGWPVTVRLSGDTSRQLPAYQWWLAIGQRMGWGAVPGVQFDLRQDGDTLHVRGRGLGHGVGLCQRGAAAWARQGRSSDWILAHYFPGTRVVRR